MKPIFVRGISNQFRLTLAIILSVFLLIANDRLDPVRQSLSTSLSPFQHVANIPGLILDWSAEVFATRDMLAIENKELLRQQLLMSERLQRFEHVRQENERLRTLLGSPVHLDSRKVVAEVMEVASDPFRQYVVLDHGSQMGVFVGQPVVDAQGVVGQVVEVSELTSRVIMVSDSTHAIPVRVTRNDVRAIANGTGAIDEIELRHVAKSTDVIVGDLLVTSGLGNRFPEGYPVARVTSVSRDDGQSYAVITAQPVAALDRIRYVLLIWPSEEDLKPFKPIVLTPEQLALISPDSVPPGTTTPTATSPTTTSPTTAADGVAVNPADNGAAATTSPASTTVPVSTIVPVTTPVLNGEAASATGNMSATNQTGVAATNATVGNNENRAVTNTATPSENGLVPNTSTPNAIVPNSSTSNSSTQTPVDVNSSNPNTTPTNTGVPAINSVPVTNNESTTQSNADEVSQ